MNLIKKNPALLLIDIQKGFKNEKHWGGNRNNKNAEFLCGEILNTCRALDIPIFHIRHSSTNEKSKLHKSNKGFDFSDYVSPLNEEPIITKDVNSAFIGTDLKEQLDTLNIETLIIAGLTTNHCISTTTRMAGNYGFETYLISDATATFDRVGINGEKYDAETIHLTALANLSEEFATIWDYDTLIASL